MILSLVGVALPTFLIGIVLILIFSVWLGWLPSFGRGTTVAFGGWTTGLLTVERPQGAGPAEPDARPVPDDADPAAGARRDAGGAAHRLHQVRARPRSDQSRRELSPCAQEHARPGHHHHRAAVRQHLRVLDHRRDRVPVAGPRSPGDPVDPVRRRAAARRLSGDDRARLCDAESLQSICSTRRSTRACAPA